MWPELHAALSRQNITKLTQFKPLEGVHNEAATALVEAAVQATKADVGEILEPLEVGHNDTTSVEVHVRQNNNAARVQDGVGCGRGGAVGTLGDDLCLDLCDVQN